jgi:hypothetical protein
MKKNLGLAHRFLRLLLAVLFAYLFFGEKAVGVWKWVTLVLSGLYLFTAFTGYSPLYDFFGKSTRHKK